MKLRQEAIDLIILLKNLLIIKKKYKKDFIISENKIK